MTVSAVQPADDGGASWYYSGDGAAGEGAYPGWEDKADGMERALLQARALIDSIMSQRRDRPAAGSPVLRADAQAGHGRPDERLTGTGRRLI
jgi:hypothetical protein